MRRGQQATKPIPEDYINILKKSNKMLRLQKLLKRQERVRNLIKRNLRYQKGAFSATKDRPDKPIMTNSFNAEIPKMQLNYHPEEKYDYGPVVEILNNATDISFGTGQTYVQWKKEQEERKNKQNNYITSKPPSLPPTGPGFNTSSQMLHDPLKLKTLINGQPNTTQHEDPKEKKKEPTQNIKITKTNESTIEAMKNAKLPDNNDDTAIPTMFNSDDEEVDDDDVYVPIHIPNNTTNVHVPNSRSSNASVSIDKNMNHVVQPAIHPSIPKIDLTYINEVD